ncbi:hypothetical protein L2E82_05521 [Cichorium intybus]|uniref:Uncharacterized protein n=1 Tax=Cichorium intybus TaxID=13427 RepID=A0ACB9H819_CICIN|nr:hypothetical protein L2E82_05521 [Cichorium intybus]
MNMAEKTMMMVKMYEDGCYAFTSRFFLSTASSFILLSHHRATSLDFASSTPNTQVRPKTSMIGRRFVKGLIVPERQSFVGTLNRFAPLRYPPSSLPLTVFLKKKARLATVVSDSPSQHIASPFSWLACSRRSGSARVLGNLKEINQLSLKSRSCHPTTTVHRRFCSDVDETRFHRQGGWGGWSYTKFDIKMKMWPTILLWGQVVGCKRVMKEKTGLPNIFASRIPRALDGVKLDDFMNFIIMFMASPEYIRNPYLRAKMVEVFNCWMPRRSGSSTVTSTLFEGHQLSVQYLVKNLLKLYVDIEFTGSHTQFYEKFNIRHNIAELLEYLWQVPVHQNAWKQSLKLKCLTQLNGNNDQHKRYKERQRQERTRLFHSQENVRLLSLYPLCGPMERFRKNDESAYDAFGAAHSSNNISVDIVDGPATPVGALSSTLARLQSTPNFR